MLKGWKNAMPFGVNRDQPSFKVVYEAGKRWGHLPPVHGMSVTSPRHHFRSHAVRRPAKCVCLLALSVTSGTHAFSIRRLQLFRATQIDQFDVAS